MKNIIGIRREDLDKRGEQRVAIIPEDVQNFSDKGFRFLVQPSIHPQSLDRKRAFQDETYIEGGATVEESLENADVIFGLKEVKPAHLIPEKTYLFFSHTHKGQVKNRPLLQAMVDKKITLMDYELMVDSEKRRLLTAFTYIAGNAGIIDSLWTLGKRLTQRGIENPFSEIPQAIHTQNLQEVKDILFRVNQKIKSEGTPVEIPPVIIAICGNGKTSAGVQELLEFLPTEDITIDQLSDIYENGSRQKIYQLVMDIPQMYRPQEAFQQEFQGAGDAQLMNAYFEAPTKFESNLDHVFPYVTCLLNCILWAPQFPRLITRAQAKTWYAKHQTLQVIGDVTCDPDGAIQFSAETWIDDPVFIYHPATDQSTNGFEGEGIAVMAVTNLPCEFSADASARFSSELKPYLPAIFLADYQADTIEEASLPPEIKGATILWKGNFTSPYAYMQEYLNS
ncbi:MAG: hypothetical protein AAFR59_03815 [Bacteroidota bacterium]